MVSRKKHANISPSSGRASRGLTGCGSMMIWCTFLADSYALAHSQFSSVPVCLCSSHISAAVSEVCALFLELWDMSSSKKRCSLASTSAAASASRKVSDSRKRISGKTRPSDTVASSRFRASSEQMSDTPVNPEKKRLRGAFFITPGTLSDPRWQITTARAIKQSVSGIKRANTCVSIPAQPLSLLTKACHSPVVREASDMYTQRERNLTRDKLLLQHLLLNAKADVQALEARLEANLKRDDELIDGLKTQQAHLQQRFDDRNKEIESLKNQLEHLQVRHDGTIEFLNTQTHMTAQKKRKIEGCRAKLKKLTEWMDSSEVGIS